MNERIEKYLERHHCRDYFNSYGETVEDEHYFMYREEVDGLVELVRADEREACAKVCEEDESGRDSGGFYADIIRARGEK